MGFFDRIKQALGRKDAVQENRFLSLAEATYTELHNGIKDGYWWNISLGKVSSFTKALSSLSDKEKVDLLLQSISETSRFYTTHNDHYGNDEKGRMAIVWVNIMQYLLKTKLTLDDAGIAAVIHSFIMLKRHSWSHHITAWPVNLLVGQVEKQLKNRPCTDELVQALNALANEVAKQSDYYNQKEKERTEERIRAIIYQYHNGNETVKPTYFSAGDALSSHANTQISAAAEEEKSYWYQLVALARKATGAKPSAKFLAESKSICEKLGTERFTQMVSDWFAFVTRFKESTQQKQNTYNGTVYTHTEYQFLAASTLDTLKGFVWMCLPVISKSLLAVLAALAERSYRKIPGKGPAAAGLGNACLYVLAKCEGLEGIAHLSRLRLRIRQGNTQNAIESYLQEAAAEQNVSIHEIEDMSVEDYGLQDGKTEYVFDDYKAVLSIAGIGKTNLQWYKPDGSLQKSVPAFIKEQQAGKLKEMKDTAKGIETTLTTQRDRFDRMLKTGRQLSWNKFVSFYHTHPLLGYITRQLVWTFITGKRTTNAIFINGKWQNPQGATPVTDEDNTIVTLWHPVYSSAADVLAWREFLIEHKIAQPLKQVFREVYILTDAEINTCTYSNRMAAHILKQHQFNSLAKLRGWKYALLGAYDNGYNSLAASLYLPDYHLRAEYWINEINADDAFNDTGIWLYIATDQVRFIDTLTDTVKELVDVPALAFSEVMRDVDLFVGIASVGNDPAWSDNGGITGHQNYWHSFSFGDLTELAKTRKMLLERLLPRLKIAGVSSIQDKFLVVKGQLRTYKIHIGSTNILMEPNDQYLCIVPDRGSKSPTENVFLPFEGDGGLSVILSKAFLLAEDTKITDLTITRQIGSK